MNDPIPQNPYIDGFFEDNETADVIITFGLDLHDESIVLVNVDVFKVELIRVPLNFIKHDFFEIVTAVL